MNLTVKIRTKPSFVIDMPEHVCGLHALDTIRSKFGTGIMLEQIASSVGALRATAIYVDVDEALARQSELFADVGDVVVTVPDKFLNKFVEEAPFLYHTYDGEDEDGSSRYCMQYRVNKEKFLDYWESLNFPVLIEGENPSI